MFIPVPLALAGMAVYDLSVSRGIEVTVVAVAAVATMVVHLGRLMALIRRQSAQSKADSKSGDADSTGRQGEVV